MIKMILSIKYCFKNFRIIKVDYHLNIKIIEQNIIFNLKNKNNILEEYEAELNLEELKKRINQRKKEMNVIVEF